MSDTPTQIQFIDTHLNVEDENHLAEFYELMKTDMANGTVRGHKDWKNIDKMSDNDLRRLIVKALNEHDYVSLGVFSMMANERKLVFSPTS